MKNKKSEREMSGLNKEKILLVMAPFWSPLIPPMGIAVIKSFLQIHGHIVKTVDLNVEETFKQYYNRYFELLKEIVPEDMIGNLHNIGHDVLQNHMMAHINYTDKGEYIWLVKQLIARYYFIEMAESQVRRLNDILTGFYSVLAEYMVNLLALEKPGILGLTVYCGNLPASMFTFKLAKEKYPHLKTVMGGGIFSQQLAMGTPNFEFFLEKTPYIDKIIIGEGQRLLLKYLQGELADSRRVYRAADLPGEIKPLSSVHLPDLSDFHIKKYVYIGATASQGCPNQCAFCNSRVFWGDYVKRDPASVVEEMAVLQKTYGFKLFYMSDALLNPVITGLSRELLTADLPIYIDAYLRVHEADCASVSDINNCLSWRRAGLYRARMGCETGSQRLLDLVGKNITVEQTRTAVSSLAYAGVKTTTYWVVGLPGETEEDFQQTLALVEELKDDIYQAECAAFIYYYSGQNNSDQWADKRMLLFPSRAKNMLVTQTWILNCEPPRQVVYERLNRFVKHTRQMGIPNPFSLHDIHKADERWKRLHKNAIPSILDIDTNKYDVKEKTQFQKLHVAHSKNPYDEGNFDF
jgi:radical SAM superfamily enzyme YgiQ (UPF0313 family)